MVRWLAFIVFIRLLDLELYFLGAYVLFYNEMQRFVSASVLMGDSD